MLGITVLSVQIVGMLLTLQASITQLSRDQHSWCPGCVEQVDRMVSAQRTLWQVAVQLLRLI
jgi:hypothetical protein